MKLFLSCLGKKEKDDHDPQYHKRLEQEENGEVERVRRKVVVVGDGECGKTCLLQRFSRDTYSMDGYLPTVFETDVVDVELDKTTVELMLTDTAGQEDYDRLRPYAYPDTDVIVVCFALDNHDSLENVRLNWVPEVRYFCGRDVPLLLVGTKADLRVQGELESWDESSISSEEFMDCGDCACPAFLQPTAGLIKQGPIKASTAVKMASDLGLLGYWETSALLDQGVSELFQAATRAALRPRSRGANKGGKSGPRKWIRNFVEKIGVAKKS